MFIGCNFSLLRHHFISWILKHLWFQKKQNCPKWTKLIHAVFIDSVCIFYIVIWIQSTIFFIVILLLHGETFQDIQFIQTIQYTYIWWVQFLSFVRRPTVYLRHARHTLLFFQNKGYTFCKPFWIQGPFQLQFPCVFATLYLFYIFIKLSIFAINL